MRIYTVPSPTFVCHNVIYRCNFTWKQRTDAGTTFHKENRYQKDTLNHKKLTLLHCMATSEVSCPKPAGREQYLRTGISPLKWQKQPSAAESSSGQVLFWEALSPCPGYCSLSKCKLVAFLQLTSLE